MVGGYWVFILCLSVFPSCLHTHRGPKALRCLFFFFARWGEGLLDVSQVLWDPSSPTRQGLNPGPAGAGSPDCWTPREVPSLSYWPVCIRSFSYFLFIRFLCFLSPAFSWIIWILSKDSFKCIFRCISISEYCSRDHKQILTYPLSMDCHVTCSAGALPIHSPARPLLPIISCCSCHAEHINTPYKCLEVWAF